MNDSIDLGGSGGRYFSFGPRGAAPSPASRIAGKVLSLAEVQATDYKTKQLETWDNGDPKMQYRVTLQTDLRDPANPTDNGVRDVYLDGARKVRDNGTMSKLCAVLEAVRAVTGGTALSVGGTLELVWVSGLGNEGDPRNFAARYLAPTVELGGPLAQPIAPPPFAQQQVQAYTQPQAPVQAPAADPWGGQTPPSDPWAVPPAQAPAQQPVTLGQAVQEVQQQLGAHPVQTEQGPVNPQTGQVLAPPPGITAEAVAAVKAGGMDPRAVWPGVDLSAFGITTP